MFSGISKKVIFFSFLFINFLQASKSADLEKINKNIKNSNSQLNWSKLSNLKDSSIYHDNPISNDPFYNYVKLFEKKTDSNFVAKADNQQELIIKR